MKVCILNDVLMAIKKQAGTKCLPVYLKTESKCCKFDDIFG